MRPTRKSKAKAKRRLPARRTPSYPALQLKQNDHRFYFATIPVDDLFKYCFVSRRGEDPQQGFQRSLSEERAEDIAAYLSDGSGSIPTNVVLSAQTAAQLSYTRKNKSVTYSRETNAFLVLDGQHRLWGYEKSPSRHRVPVAIYEGLSRAEEARLFIDINTNQRGVPAALLLDIKQLAQIEGARDQILRHLFDRLAEDKASPLAGKLSPAKSLTGKISRVTFNRAISVAIESRAAQSMSAEARYKSILNYLQAFDAELPDKRLLVRSSFFEAIFEVFDEVVRATIAAKGNAKPEALRETIRPISRIDFTAAPGGQAQFTKRALTNLMQAALRTHLKITEEML